MWVLASVDRRDYGLMHGKTQLRDGFGMTPIVDAIGEQGNGEFAIRIAPERCACIAREPKTAWAKGTTARQFWIPAQHPPQALADFSVHCHDRAL